MLYCVRWKKMRIWRRIRLEINHFTLHQNAVDHNIHTIRDIYNSAYNILYNIHTVQSS